MKHIIPFNGNFPLSSAIIHDSKYTMEISGLIGFNTEKGILEEGIEGQTKYILETLKNILQNVGWDMDNILKARIFLIDMNDYAKMNEIYGTYFSGEYPTRFTLAVKELPRGALVEIECTAGGDSIKIS